MYAVVVAASAGGLSALSELLSALPQEFPAPLILVQHLPASDSYQSRLPQILSRFTHLTVKWVEQDESLRAGNVYLAPQDVQTRVTSNLTFDISQNVRRWGARPAADPLFSSVAEVFGRGALAVVLTGVLSDGAIGAQKIAAAGGRVLIQNTETAEFFDMPLATLRKGVVDFMLSPIRIAHTLTALLMAPGADAWFRVVNKLHFATPREAALESALSSGN